ncbi:hypothetical protein AB0F96_36315 [Streptomyces sp. NPDC023998]|uniref:hypothetical protein n=1 Tax=Streptomyces sp. NPDC023998 TaxID=3154597 RepID=UPI0033D78FC7
MFLFLLVVVCRGRSGHAVAPGRDYERLIQHSEAHIAWSTITLMTRRLTKPVKQRTALPPAST